MYRLKDVQSGLTEAEEEADETRKESRRARDEFLELKKKRCDLFYKAYNHMSGCIDKVYKELTRDKHHVHGGVAFLSLEDAEVSSALCVLGQSLLIGTIPQWSQV
jgi:structural maintenance of chromosome 1